MRANTAEQWLQERVRKYGPVSKLSLFGKPAVFIFGPAAHKLIFGSDANTVSNQQAKSNQMILGDRNLLELMGEDHKRVRGALVSFLKPESLKQYVGRMDAEVRNHLQLNWEGKQRVTVSTTYGKPESLRIDFSMEYMTEPPWYFCRCCP